MKSILKKLISAAAVIFTTVALSGCAIQYGDGLLALPSLPAEYIELQGEIDKVFATGAVSAAAESGSNRQSIQLVDIDGDSETETVAFFRTAEGNYLIKAYKKNNENYEEIGSAEAVGLTLHSIYYPTSSVTGQKCLAVCWGIDESNNYGMTVYSFTDKGMENILSVQYSGILVGDFYGDSLDELCFAIKDQAGGMMSLRVYEARANSYELGTEVPLCSEARSISRMTLGRYKEDDKALFLDSVAYGGGYVSDVITFEEGSSALKNISKDRDSGSGIRTWRAVEEFCQDIDDDGIIEVPAASSMMSALYPDEKYKLSWNAYSDEGTQQKLKTFHMSSDEWYIEWPENWDDRIVVQTTRYSRMVKTVFFSLPDDYSIDSLPQGTEANTLLTVYIFSGDNKEAYVKVYEAETIVQKDGLLYAFTLGSGAEGRYEVLAEDILEKFTRIENEWTLEVY
ncbi:MAG: hypothetical protein IIY11_00470 [Clostridia bacterium]|nr:hypothetical protein [Clostridia bacterium]MBQ2326111.1 hypothetical protein [Clostridia bacterium]